MNDNSSTSNRIAALGPILVAAPQFSDQARKKLMPLQLLSPPTLGGMPEISRFFGIVIGMFHREHGPPHFHATYGDYHVVVDIESASARGKFPVRAKAMIREGKPLKRIRPLH